MPGDHRQRTWPALRWVRRAVQLVSLALFVYLLFAAVQSREAAPNGAAWFRVDPLAGFVAMLASRSWLPAFALAFVTVALTIALGRVFCGWLCPLGTLLGWLRFPRARRRARRLPPRLRAVKYWLLAAIVTMAAFGLMTLMVLDPLALLTRTATTVFIPALDYVVTGAERALQQTGLLQGAVDAVETHLRGPVLPVTQPHYSQAILFGLLFVALVALNALADRFWCRYLCPLGALLGLLAKVSLLRPAVAPACDSCGRCGTACRLDAIETQATSASVPANAGVAAPPTRTTSVVSSECTVCLDCLVACRREPGMSFALSRRPGPWVAYDPGRRDFITAAAAGVGAVALLGTGVWQVRRDRRLIRPPGVTDETSFLERCLRCAECMKVCPTSGLQPTLDEAGLTGFWTPVLKPRLGACTYDCNACGRTCPSGAIPDLALPVKQRAVIGLAVIDRDRCLPWARRTPCIVCQEMCPLPTKAISLTTAATVTTASGARTPLQRPLVDATLCIGCGLCEYHCPLEGAAAIRVERAAPNGGAPVEIG